MKKVKRWYSQYLYLKNQKKLNKLNSLNFNRLFVEGNSHLNSEGVLYKTELRSREFSVFSQNGEDGLISWILRVIKPEKYTFVEFGIGDGTQCNCRNLVENHGWRGLFIEGNEKKADKARKFYGEQIGAQVVVANSFITKENINELITTNLPKTDVDILSVDIDGNDYWVWKAIDCINPRIVILEYNSSFGSDESRTIPYEPEFVRFAKEKRGWYHGISFQAGINLGKEKGYRFVAAESQGVNMFFVREDLYDEKVFRVGDPKGLFYEQASRSREMPLPEQIKYVNEFPIVDTSVV